MDGGSVGDGRAPKDALGRYAVLQLAEEVGSVAEACRQAGITRMTFYRWQRRHAEAGLDGLVDRPPVHRGHPSTTSTEVAQRVVARALSQPTRGAAWVASSLADDGLRISAPTVQKCLTCAGLGSVERRAEYLERRCVEDGWTLNEEQIAALEQRHPAFRDRAEPVSRPGERLILTRVPLGRLPQIDIEWRGVYVAVDAYSGLAFARQVPMFGAAQYHAALLEWVVLPWFRRNGIPVQAVRTVWWEVAEEGGYHPVTAVLTENGIRQDSGHRLHSVGIVAELVRQLYREWRPQVVRRGGLPSGEWPIHHLYQWLEHRNNFRRQPGFPNFGATPMQRLRPFARDLVFVDDLPPVLRRTRGEPQRAPSPPGRPPGLPDDYW